MPTMTSSLPPPPVVRLVVVVVALLLASSHPRTTTTCVQAGWIDEDTPPDARTTIPLGVAQYIIPPPAAAKTGPTVDATAGGAASTSTATTAREKKIKKAGGGSTAAAAAAVATSDPTTTTSPAAPGTRVDPTPPPPPAAESDVDEAETSTSSTSAGAAADGAEADKGAEAGGTEDGRGGAGGGAPPPPDPAVRTYDLVFSDEFNAPHRTFEDGSDPRWTALDKNDYTNDAQHYYSPRNARTDSGGNLVITTESADTDVVGFNDVTRENERVTKHFRSAMLQSWDKFCFAGGILEAEMSLPGRHDVGGLWPAFWMLGNLARHTYVGSSEHVWPWASTRCTEKGRTAQMVNACDRAVHYGMERGVGRGAPEIDVFEVQAGNVAAGSGDFARMPVGQPFASHSYQVAPGRLPRPGEGWYPGPGGWYDGLRWGEGATLNIAFYGSYNHFNDDTDPASQDYWSDAISFNRQLNSSHFGGMHRYRVEWELPDVVGGDGGGGGEGGGGGSTGGEERKYGYLRWFIDDRFVMEVDGRGLHDSGTGGEISSEPMYMLLNTAVSSQWGE